MKIEKTSQGALHSTVASHGATSVAPHYDSKH